jgi:hypothetical protein
MGNRENIDILVFKERNILYTYSIEIVKDLNLCYSIFDMNYYYISYESYKKYD